MVHATCMLQHATKRPSPDLECSLPSKSTAANVNTCLPAVFTVFTVFSVFTVFTVFTVFSAFTVFIQKSCLKRYVRTGLEKVCDRVILLRLIFADDGAADATFKIFKDRQPRVILKASKMRGLATLKHLCTWEQTTSVRLLEKCYSKCRFSLESHIPSLAQATPAVQQSITIQ